jgi:UDP-4-amino-4-deoxy-L-arabinose formyltransferase/UDP-glucuronic acid dehydrogenase (UDP-4-keto-hexauronic acid decarboxylating)
MRIAAIGRTQWLLDAVRRLGERGHEIVAVATARAAPEYRVSERDFERLGEELGCPVSVGPDLAASAVATADADVAVSVNWPTLIPSSILERFPLGVLNGHPGALPRFRGNAAPNWAILAGEEEVVATVHRMDAGLDSGPIVAQSSFALDESTYIGDVYAFLAEAFPELFIEAVEGLGAGSVVPREQPTDPNLALRGYPRLPRDGELDWSKGAAALARVVRASAEPFAGAYSWLDTERVTVWRAHHEPLPEPALGTPGQVAHVRRQTGEVAVLAGDGLLVLEEVERGGTRAPAAELLPSARFRLGLDAAALLERLAQPGG